MAHVTFVRVFSCLWQTKLTAVSTSVATVRTALHSRRRPTSVSTPLSRRQFMHTNSRVSVLWPYKPRETDEFALDRGEMLQILRIYDDQWADGYRLGERAEESGTP
jgi:hypothetical protein